MQKIEALTQARQYLLTNKYEQVRHVITDNYPFKTLESTSRSYTDRQMIQQFKKDGFIDRYSGGKLVNPGFLKALSHYMPEEFPYHSHWKMEACHHSPSCQMCLKSPSHLPSRLHNKSSTASPSDDTKVRN